MSPPPGSAPPFSPPCFCGRLSFLVIFHSRNFYRLFLPLLFFRAFFMGGLFFLLHTLFLKPSPAVRFLPVGFAEFQSSVPLPSLSFSRSPPHSGLVLYSLSRNNRLSGPFRRHTHFPMREDQFSIFPLPRGTPMQPACGFSCGGLFPPLK